VIDVGPKLVFSADDVCRPFVTASESLWRAFQPELARLREDAEAGGSTIDRVRAAIRECLPSGEVSIDAAAQRLRVGRRTLQRRLSATLATPPARRSIELSLSSSTSTRSLSPRRGSKRLHQISTRWADSREIWALPGVQPLDEFVKYDADLWRKTSAYKGLGKSVSYCVEQ